MDHFLSVFALGSVLYFIITAGVLVALFWFVEKEKPLGSGIWLILYLLFLQFMAGVNFIQGTIHHPVIAGLWVLAYFAVGFFWSFAKWWVFVNKYAEKLREVRYNYLKERKESGDRRSSRVGSGSFPELNNLTMDTKVPETLRNDWETYLLHDGRRAMSDSLGRNEGSSLEVVPTVRKNKGKISLWIIYWPVSMVWALITDFVKRVIHTVVMKCHLLYGMITKGAFKNLDVPSRGE